MNYDLIKNEPKVNSKWTMTRLWIIYELTKNELIMN